MDWGLCDLGYRGGWGPFMVRYALLCKATHHERMRELALHGYSPRTDEGTCFARLLTTNGWGNLLCKATHHERVGELALHGYSPRTGGELALHGYSPRTEGELALQGYSPRTGG